MAGALLIFATACGSGSDDGALEATLPNDGELGEGWVRDGSPRSGDGESAALCGVNLDEGKRDGAKLDLVHPEDGAASTFHRRYDGDGAARKAFANARSQLAECPEPGVAVAAKGRPDAGDESFFVVLSADDIDVPFAGWTIVRTGADIRSMLVTPASAASGATLSDQMERLSRALATT